MSETPHPDPLPQGEGGSTPLVCRVDALDPPERARQRTLVSEISGALAGVEELADGYAVRFPARPFLFLRLAEWIELERRCCPFLTIQLELRRQEREIRVSLTGASGVKDFLRAELPSLAAAPDG